MKIDEYNFKFQVFDSIRELEDQDALLLKKALDATSHAYAPYSNFHVGAVARLVSGEIIRGSNQENASFPVGICAERVLLATSSSLYPNSPIETIAVSYQSDLIKSDHPIAPCGMCRQSLQEYETRMKHPIRLILGGKTGKIFIIPNAAALLPFSFTSEDLKINLG